MEINGKVLIVCNPLSGKGKGGRHAKRLCHAITKRGGDVEVFESKAIEHTYEFCKENAGNPFGYSLVVVIGGDGTLSIVLDAMLKNEFVVPIYAFGGGTANDFSSYFRTNKRVRRAVKIIETGNLVWADTLLVNANQHAVNNAAGGAFTNGVTNYSKRSKKIFGRFAYLFKAFFSAFTLKSQVVKFKCDDEEFSADVFLFYILNTKSVGSLKCAGGHADPSDGKLDLVCICKCRLWGKICIGLSVLFKRLHRCKSVIYRQGQTFDVEIIGEAGKNFTHTDIDGNPGAPYPLLVDVGQKIQVVSNRKKV